MHCWWLLMKVVICAMSIWSAVNLVPIVSSIFFFLNNNLGNGTVTVESHPLSLEQLLNFATFHNTRGMLLVPTQKILNAVPYWYSP